MALQNIARVPDQFLSDSTCLHDSTRTDLEEQLLALQWAQLRHDQFYHSDIVLLPVGQRMKHFALHMAKYVGHIAEALESGDDALLQRTLVDAFIISLASANTLQLDLGKAFSSRCDSSISTLEDLAVKLATTLKRAKGDASWLLRTMAQYTGHLSKACESLDHIEDYPFRRTMLDSARDLFEVVLVEASLRGIDLLEKAAGRIQSIEGKHLFHDRHERK
jgi:hypothetical protein